MFKKYIIVRNVADWRTCMTNLMISYVMLNKNE